jgi:hypothetical protein
MRTLLMNLFIAAGLLYIIGMAVVFMDCTQRDKGACVAMSVLWPVTIPIAVSGR